MMPRPRSDIEPRIVSAARQRFLEEGVDGASLRRIARDAGTSIGMIYYYFPTKDDLFLAVVEDTYATLLERLGRALDPELSVEERIAEVYRMVSRLTPLDRQVIQLVVREALISSARLDRLIARFQRGHLPLVMQTVVEGVSDGTFRRDLHPALIMMCVFAVGIPPQLMRRVVGAKQPFSKLPRGDALAAQLADVLFTGLGGPGAPARRGKAEGEPARRGSAR